MAYIIKIGRNWYLRDNGLKKSLGTEFKGEAQRLLDKYRRGKLGLNDLPTVGEYYESWIMNQMGRKSLARDYRQHFTRYILPEFSVIPISSISVNSLKNFQGRVLLGCGLSLKTVRNVIDGSFRAMWRAAMKDFEELKNPFTLLEWPAIKRLRPVPYTVEDRDKLLAYFRDYKPYWYPVVLFQFATGCRPSETSAIKLKDTDFERCTVLIEASRNLYEENDTKTTASQRIIPVPRDVMDVLKAMQRPPQCKHLFFNMIGKPLDLNQFERKFWRDAEKAAGVVEPVKFYATRHTFITEAVKRGENIKAVADYCGTSPAMIEKNYCGKVELRSMGPALVAPVDVGNVVGL